MKTHLQRPKTVLAALTLAAATALTSAACSGGGAHAAAATAADHAPAAAVVNDKAVALYTAMRTLWSQHMEWTYDTVDAFFNNPHALAPTLDRLLQNQRDIGDAIVPFYGQAAGTKLTDLLTTHIKEAVPVLTAAKKGDKKALAKALDDWNSNAKQIADFLSAANSANWPTSATEPMLKTHITQTTTYSVDLLKRNYKQAIEDYGKAESHMLDLADVLSKGIIAQHPDKF